MFDLHAPTLPEPAPVRAGAGRQRALAYGGAAALCAAAAALAWALHWALDTASLVLLFLLAVVLSAVRFGRGPATLAAGLAVLLFNLMFVPPRYSFAVADEQFFFTFAIMLGVGLLVAQLTAGLRAQAEAAQARERQMRSLYEISRELGGALTPAQVAEAMARFSSLQLNAAMTLWVRDRSDRLQVFGGAPGSAGGNPAVGGADASQVARVAALIGPAPPADADPFDADGRACLLPLQATMAVRGALELQRPEAAGPWRDEERQLLQTGASLLAGALERIHYIDVAQATAVEIEGERLRNVLLAAVSHDLRTPLSALIGLAESVELTRPAPTVQQREIAAAIAGSARRMSAMVDNLLDMARLQSGRVQLNLQWQPLEEVVGTAVAAVPGLAPPRPLHIAIPADLPLVCIDAVLMERVLVNLLENAVKYSPADAAIEILAAAEPGWLSVTVRDHGPGLPAGRAQDLFRMFERGQRESATPGVGLALALSQAIVQAHGGTVQAEPADGGGARFVVRLPRGEPPPVPAEDDPGAELA